MSSVPSREEVARAVKQHDDVQVNREVWDAVLAAQTNVLESMKRLFSAVWHLEQMNPRNLSVPQELLASADCAAGHLEDVNIRLARMLRELSVSATLHPEST